MENKNTIIIEVDDKTLAKINEHIQYWKHRNNYHRRKKVTLATVENFVKGCLFLELDLLDVKREVITSKGLIRNNFKEIANKKGITQESIVRSTGMSPSKLSMIFNNKSQPSMDTLLALWEVLDFPLIEEMFYRE